MRNIYIEVPTTTNEVMMSIPYRNDELLGKIHVIFTELDESKVRIVTVRAKDSEDDKDWSIQSKQVMSKNMRTVEFDFDFRDDDGIKLHVSTKIMLSYSHRFFIFDEQRVIGSGTWVKAFLKIAKSNEWILLSATPGDTWQDYIPVFIANGFYKNRSEFIREHVIYSRFSKFPKIDRYIDTGRLIRLRNSILVNMDFKRQTVSHHEDIYVKYDVSEYKMAGKNRWNPFKQEPIVYE